MTADTPALLVGIAALALGTFAFRFAGPLLAGRWTIPERFEQLTAIGTVVLLTALVATATFIEDREISSPARIIGVGVGGVLAWRRVPFVAVVVAAAGSTALLRLVGMP
ncbi:AzlD domain-containing protein [Williamsia sp.]|uniref:AzlD domain-containing protein n=1 Tax=Williamsia sp. TaxID=1872085 RepID=UPI002F927788